MKAIPLNHKRFSAKTGRLGSSTISSLLKILISFIVLINSENIEACIYVISYTLLVRN
jgi:hypothetical protein